LRQSQCADRRRIDDGPEGTAGHRRSFRQAAARRAAGANWSPKTLRPTEKGYGLWLGCLAPHGRLDPNTAPGARLTRETLTLFGTELLARVAPQTAASRVRDLSVMIRVLDPDADRRLVRCMQATSPAAHRQTEPSASA
jgi:hypothetical protein